MAILAILAALTLGLALGPLPAQALPMKSPKVLVIYSYSRGLPWDRMVIGGMDEVTTGVDLASRPYLFEEFLDSARLGDQGQETAMAAHIAEKYSQISLDMVMTESQQAAAFLLANPVLLPGAKRLIFHYAPATSLGPGRGDELKFSSTLDLGRALGAIQLVRPQTERVVAIVDGSAVGLARAEQLAEIRANLEGAFALEIWDSFTEEELLAKAGKLPANSAILYLPVQIDRLGKPLVPGLVAARLAEAASVPVFSHFDSLLGSGIVGGWLVSGLQLGRLMGKVAWKGIEAAPASQEAYSAATMGYYFDRKALLRWGIPPSALPSGSVILNKEKTFLERYWAWVLGLGAAFALETLLLVALFRISSQRRRTLGLLDAERASLEERVESRTRDLANLLKELQHRVKNSMAITASLVSLEAGKATDPEAKSSLERLESRIAALATLYDILYESEGSDQVSLEVYLGRIVSAAAEGLGAELRGISVSIAVCPEHMDLKRALSLGLIVNELITDALKYAFPESRTGRVSLRLGREGESFVLEVEDDGVGLPAGFDPENAEGFGLRLVGILADQLQGSFSAGQAPALGGAGFRLSFPA